MKLKSLIVVLLCIVVCSSCEQPPIEAYAVLPQPQEINYVQGFVKLKDKPMVVYSNELSNEALLLASYLKNDFAVEVTLEEGKDKGDVILLLDSTVLPDKKGGYVLEAAGSRITIKASTPEGVFNGVQTLRKIIKEREGRLTVQKALVTDYPAFSWRAFMLDEGRYFKGKEVVLNLLDRMAELKMNVFHWHLTDDQAWRVEMKCRPELTEKGSIREGEIFGLYPGKYQPLPYGGYYTHEDVHEIVRYAAERHITVIPEIDIPGHCMAVLATYPQFSTTPNEPKKAALTWGIFNKFNNVLAPKPEVFDFLKDVFSELCDLFPGQYIHVGGDECAKRWWQESEETQQFMREHELKDEKALQSYFIHYVQEVVNAKGKTLIGWDEILEGGISEDCIVMNWRRPEFGKKAVRTNHRTIFTCSAWSYFNLKESRIQSEIGPRGPLSLEKVYEFQIVPDSLTTEQQELVWGAQGCRWTEYIPTTWKAEFAIFPRMSALAENVWSPLEKKDWINFTRKVEMQFERYELWGARYSEAFFRTHDIERKR